MHGITNFLEDHGVEGQAVYRINLAMEELITNTIKFGYADYDSHNIDIALEVGDEDVIATIQDDGREFDPIAQKEVDLNIPLEDRRIGGLGIHLLKKLLDSIEYRREGHRNIISIRTRRIPAA